MGLPGCKDVRTLYFLGHFLGCPKGPILEVKLQIFKLSTKNVFSYIVNCINTPQVQQCARSNINE
jgi:hypothetical protein